MLGNLNIGCYRHSKLTGVNESKAFKEDEDEASVGCTKTVLIRTEIERTGVRDGGPSKGGLLTVAASLVEGNPTVPEGLRVRAIYPKRLSGSEPQVSVYPGHGSLHESREVVWPGT